MIILAIDLFCVYALQNCEVVCVCVCYQLGSLEILFMTLEK